MKKVEIKKEKKILIITSVVIIILSILLLVSRHFGDFSKVSFKKNNNNIFSVSDLSVNNLKYSDDEENVKKELGKPKKEEKYIDNNYEYKKLKYDGITVHLKEFYDKYVLVKVEITSKKYKINRNIKVNDRIEKTINKFKVENSTGTYIYGNYSSEALDEQEITENIYFAVRNNKEIVYINRDSKISNIKSNIARLNITYKSGRITKIVWSYDLK